MATVLCWFHQDLRLADHPALDAAIADGHAVIPLYILDDAAAGDWAMGGASRWWLNHSLASLADGLGKLGSRLVLAKGRAEEIIPQLMARTGAEAVYTHCRHEPWSKAQAARVETALQGRGQLKTFHGTLLKSPGEVLSKTGTRLRVFTPFKRNLLAGAPPRPELAAPQHIPSPQVWPESLGLDDLALLPQAPDWSGGLNRAWQVGEAAAHAALDRFIDTTIDRYDTSRDLPGETGTSRLSPHLHFGEISPVSIYHRVMARGGLTTGAEVFLSEVIWREFSYELLDQSPHMPDAPLRGEFNAFPWRDDYADDLRAWQQGRTGYPLVDAGMRELYETGWMHNRVRMITASFLTKHLLIPWQEGERWFWDTLVDADLASNSAGWQWVAGCGADASPYFRVFNPITQGDKFTAHGYVRRWLPELAGVDDRSLFAPFDADPMLTVAAGLQPGKTYPLPLVAHPEGRARALAAFEVVKANK